MMTMGVDQLAYELGKLQERMLVMYDIIEKVLNRVEKLENRMAEEERKLSHATSSAALAEDVKRRMQG